MKDDILVQHILECINLIDGYLKGKSKNDFLSSIQLQDSVIRRIEIIGEASKNISTSFKEEHKEISWKEISGMRDILVHKYFGVDLDSTWKTVKIDLPYLKKKLYSLR